MYWAWGLQGLGFGAKKDSVSASRVQGLGLRACRIHGLVQGFGFGASLGLHGFVVRGFGAYRTLAWDSSLEFGVWGSNLFGDHASS